MKEKIALDLFKSGLNCAQAVLTTYAEDLQERSDYQPLTFI
jgi:hypothetical protein